MKITIQTGNLTDRLGFEKGSRMIKECGFDGVDWNIDHAWNGQEVWERRLSSCVFEMSMEDILDYYFQELRAMRNAGLAICQAHAPFPAYVPGYPELDQRVIPIYKQCVRFCYEVECPILVIHGIYGHNLSREEIRKKNIDLYSALIPVLQETGVVICMENLYLEQGEGEKMVNGVCCDPEEAIYLIDTLNELAGKECFGLCFDTGHLNLVSGDYTEYLRKLGKRIKALHLHDNFGKDDDHRMPYTGTICWKDVYDTLKEIGYTGNLNFETAFQYDLDWMDPVFVPIFLRAIADIGKQFRKIIQGE